MGVKCGCVSFDCDFYGVCKKLKVSKHSKREMERKKKEKRKRNSTIQLPLANALSNALFCNWKQQIAIVSFASSKSRDLFAKNELKLKRTSLSFIIFIDLGIASLAHFLFGLNALSFSHLISLLFIWWFDLFLCPFWHARTKKKQQQHNSIQFEIICVCCHSAIYLYAVIAMRLSFIAILLLCFGDGAVTNDSQRPIFVPDHLRSHLRATAHNMSIDFANAFEMDISIFFSIGFFHVNAFLSSLPLSSSSSFDP